MYKGIDQWTEMFAKYRKMKELEKDPDRFKNNRGGKLLKQQKEMALIKRKLPGLENQVNKKHFQKKNKAYSCETSFIESNLQALKKKNKLRKRNL